MNNNIKKCTEKAKENWTGEQCREIEQYMRKNSMRAYQLVKDLTTVKQGKATTVQNRSGKCLTEELHIITGLQNGVSQFCTTFLEKQNCFNISWFKKQTENCFFFGSMATVSTEKDLFTYFTISVKYFQSY